MSSTQSQLAAQAQALAKEVVPGPIASSSSNPSSVTTTEPPQTVKQLMADVQQLQQQISQLADANSPEAIRESIRGLSAQEAQDALMQDPIGFVRRIVQEEASHHLVNLREEAELRGALGLARKQYPEMVQFEPIILDEVAQLIKNDPDGDIDPWSILIEKAIANFQAKFEQTLAQNPDLLKQQSQQVGQKAQERAYLEGRANRLAPSVQPAFSRDRIAKMSMAEFLANEAAIDEAMRQNRIK